MSGIKSIDFNRLDGLLVLNILQIRPGSFLYARLHDHQGRPLVDAACSTSGVITEARITGPHGDRALSMAGTDFPITEAESAQLLDLFGPAINVYPYAGETTERERRAPSQ